MKRSRLSYDEWSCITDKVLLGKYVHSELIDGYIGMLSINQVNRPQIWTFNGENIVVCDKGLKWLTILPKEEFYCITAMMNETNEILLWYIDMIAGQGMDHDEAPYFDDLYLDLVVYPNGQIVEDDRDELEEALAQGNISRMQFDLANTTAEGLKRGLLSDVTKLKKYTELCYRVLKGCTKVGENDIQ